MDTKEKKELILKNVVEVIEEKELDEILKKKQPVVYCGYEPSGPIHLGHFVTITKLLDFQKAGFKVKILLADWHARLNKKGTFEEIRKQTEKWKKDFTKLGLDKAEFIIGTSFQKNEDYINDVFSLAVDTTINRALRSMQQVARDIENANVGQVIYPFMQAVDIKHLKVDVAYGGLEQRKIHMIARELLPSINYKAPTCVHTPLITSLSGPGEKMSSSKPETMISLDDKPDEIKNKVRKAYCPEKVSEENPILQISKLIIFPRIKIFEIKRDKKYGGDISLKNYKELEKSFTEGKIHPLDLKNTVAEYLIEILK